MEVRGDRAFVTRCSPEQVWTMLEDVARYPTWWGWLRRFDGERLRAGERWSCCARSPLGWPISFVVHLAVVEPRRSVRATVTGSVTGSAAVMFTPTGDGGTAIAFSSCLVPTARGLRAVCRLCPPAAHWAHLRLVTAAITGVPFPECVAPVGRASRFGAKARR